MSKRFMSHTFRLTFRFFKLRKSKGDTSLVTLFTELLAEIEGLEISNIHYRVLGSKQIKEGKFGVVFCWVPSFFPMVDCKNSKFVTKDSF